jgi:hypothetical protein
MRCWLALALALLSARTARAQAEDAEPSQTEAAAENGDAAPRDSRTPKKWTLRVRAQLRGEYNDNVFFLSPASLARLRRVTDPPSRHAGMDSYRDWVVTPGLRGELRGPSPLGRRLSVSLGVTYAIYLQNRAKNFPELTLDVRQDIGKRGRVHLRVDEQLGYFYNNAIIGGEDLNGSGSIDSAERLYAQIIYNELVATGSYAHVLRKEGRAQPLAVELTGTVGYYRRSFRAPLAVRLENAPLGSAAIALAYRKLAHLELAYTYMRVFNTPHPEVVLLDENAWGIDFNEPPDGNTTDTHVSTTQRVDRSYVMHRLGLGVSITPWRRLEIGAEYDLRARSFTSSEPRDVAHFDRLDTRHVAAFSVGYRLSSRWRFELGYRYTIQSTRRTPAPGMSLQRTAYEINRIFAELTATL